MKKKSRATWLLAVLAMFALLMAACGDDGGDDSSSGSGDSGSLSGSIKISGSSTVEPISALAREEFIAENGDVDISVDGPGTGDGFALFCDGETDISDASRAIDEEEVATCEKNGIEFIELRIAIDGLSVITQEDDELECLNFADLYALIGPESEGFENWSDAQTLAEELGSDTKMPDQNLVITAPGEESGTYDSFIEIALSDIAEARVEEGKIKEDVAETTRADYSASPDDNAIIEGVAGDSGGLGWVGFAFADQAEGVKLMPVASAPGEKCVAPSAETIQDGSYPIARPLYIYVNKAKAAANESLTAFVDYYLESLTDLVEASDYIPLADDAETLAAWTDKTAGAQEAGG